MAFLTDAKNSEGNSSSFRSGSWRWKSASSFFAEAWVRLYIVLVPSDKVLRLTVAVIPGSDFYGDEQDRSESRFRFFRRAFIPLEKSEGEMEVIDPCFFGDVPGIAREVPHQSLQLFCRIGCVEPILDSSLIRHATIRRRSDSHRFELIGQSIEDSIERLSFEEERFPFAEPIVQQWVSETQIEELRLEAFQLAADIDLVFRHIAKSEKSWGIGEIHRSWRGYLRGRI